MKEIVHEGGLTSLAMIASSLHLEDVPESSLVYSLKVVADTIGVIIAGARDTAVSTYATSIHETSEGAQLFTQCGKRCSPDIAALVNGTAGGTLEMDEGNRPYGHPAMHVFPAVFAVAQSIGASGNQMLEAFLTGYEATARLFLAYRLKFPTHAHGHLGGVGAAIGVARLLGIDPVAAAEVAATTPLLTVWSGCYEGATARNTFMGTAAANAIRACGWSAAGMKGSAGALDESFGNLVGTLVEPEALTKPIDPSALSITRNYIKPYGACALVLTAIDAALEIRDEWSRQRELNKTTVETRVLLETSQNAMHLSRQPLENDLSSRFSLQYAVAAALLLGPAGVRPVRFDPTVAEVARSVTVVPRSEFDIYAGETTPARVSLLEENSLSIERIYAPGDYRNPLNDGQLRDKFTHLVAHENADDLYDRILSLRDCASCNDIAPPPYEFTETKPLIQDIGKA